MANEGSTKPTYSELEAENLRVRGLLQRQWISVEERLPENEEVVLTLVQQHLGSSVHVNRFRTLQKYWESFGMSVTHWQPIVLPNFPQSSELVSQGAESADIGKLDTAQEEKADV